MAKNQATPLVLVDRMKEVAEEQAVGDRFEGESERSRRIGPDREVVVDIFRRNQGRDAGTYFLRVSLDCPIRTHPKITTRYEIDLDTYVSEAEFLTAVEIGGGSIAERQCDVAGAQWDCEYVAKQARAAATELLRDISNQ